MSISTNHPAAPFAADMLIQAIEQGYSPTSIGQAEMDLIVAIDGQPALYRDMTAEGRLLYLLALTIKAAA